ncbi:hypothetical protein HZB00_00875 [Candidatus Woesearchaeota archaeon]|nr:hypothetical protein [Candidatus Woesearchaeota archaeon]
MKKAKYITLGILVALIALLLYLTHTRDCGTDENCFNWEAKGCVRTTVQATSQNNEFRYTIEGKSKNLCVIKVELLKMSPDAPESLRKAIENKGMLCAVPQELLLQKPLSKIEEINEYCTGPLKEVLLQISLDKLEEVIVKNIGPITSQLKTALESLNGTG